MIDPRPIKRVGPAERLMVPIAPLMAGHELPHLRLRNRAADALRDRYGQARPARDRSAAPADATSVRRPMLRAPSAIADGLDEIVGERRLPADAVATGEEDARLLRRGPVAMPGRNLREIVNGPQPTNVEPAGGDFQSAYRFVLGQEVPIRDRARPGRAVQEAGPDGDVGIDPPGQREFARRHPAMWREISDRLSENAEATFGRSSTDANLIGKLPKDEQQRRRSVWKAGNAGAARSVYADIWNASGADRLDEPLATIHFDAAVQHGAGVARQFLRQSGGDVSKYLALREGRYRENMTEPGAHRPRGRFQEAPAHQGGWLKQRMPALRALVHRR